MAGETPEAQSPMISKVIAGGDVAELFCPEGTTPGLNAGELLPNAEKPDFYVIAIKDHGFTVGPMKVGTFEVVYRCSDNQEYRTSIEVPAQEADKLPPHEGPLALIAFSLWWLWVAIALLILAALASVIVYRVRKVRAHAALKRQEAQAKASRKDPQQLLRDMIAAADSLRAEELYQKGYRSVRGYLEKELKLKTQAETTPQFLGSLKIIAPKHKIPSELVTQIERCLMVSDQNRFGAGTSDSEDARRHYATELKSILTHLLRLSAQWQEPVVNAPKGRSR
ncbi:MAG TPA: hypothetical protein VM901_13115 [Bdellovibrionota bacterium]|jgi:hypothetical protein|nr:hypothetical protein [Bdellovibrionota bacterium]